uniref:MYND-type domain-containing protein n=1 Tax=Parastrongyloides trichosuri TaxID=131310 RepID=A0A0N5A535_PARTI
MAQQKNNEDINKSNSFVPNENNKTDPNKKVPEGKDTKDPAIGQSKAETTKAFEAVENILLKLADKVFTDKNIKKDDPNMKGNLIDNSQKTFNQPLPKRKPVSVYLAPIETNNKQNSNLRSTYMDDHLNGNANNNDLAFNDQNLVTPVEKATSYEDIKAMTPKEKKKTVIVPVNNLPSDPEREQTPLTTSDTNSKKSKRMEINPGMYADTTIPQLAIKRKSQRQNSDRSTKSSSNVSTAKQINSSVTTGSTTTALEINKNKNKSENSEEFQERLSDKSYEEAFEEECRNCPECSSPKKHKKHRKRSKKGFKKDLSSGSLSEKYKVHKKPNYPIFSTPRTSKCSTASPIKIGPNKSQENDGEKLSNGSSYVVPLNRHHYEQFNDNTSVDPYTARKFEENHHKIPFKDHIFGNDGKTNAPPKEKIVLYGDSNIEDKNKLPLLKIESPKVARFYEMQHQYDYKNNEEAKKKSPAGWINEKITEMKNAVNELAVKTARALSPYEEKTPGKTQFSTSVATASSGGLNNQPMYPVKNISNSGLETAVRNESEDVITDSFVPYHLRAGIARSRSNSEKQQTTAKKFQSPRFSNGMFVILDDDKGNRVTVNISNIVKSFSNNNDGLSPYAVYMNGNQIWKREKLNSNK